MRVLETGFASRAEESSLELGERCVIAAPVIVTANLLGALVAVKPIGKAFPVEAEIRLRSFSDLVAQSIANERAQEEMRASRARIVRAADEARQKLERNLHDGAQQRLVSVSISLRLALHPAILTKHGLGQALEVLAERAPSRSQSRTSWTSACPRQWRPPRTTWSRNR